MVLRRIILSSFKTKHIIKFLQDILGIAAVIQTANYVTYVSQSSSPNVDSGAFDHISVNNLFALLFTLNLFQQPQWPKGLKPCKLK